MIVKAIARFDDQRSNLSDIALALIGAVTMTIVSLLVSPLVGVASATALVIVINVGLQRLGQAAKYPTLKFSFGYAEQALLLVGVGNATVAVIITWAAVIFRPLDMYEPSGILTAGAYLYNTVPLAVSAGAAFATNCKMLRLLRRDR